MKKMKHFLFSLVIFTGLFVLVSCDPFFAQPAGRVNVRDPDRPITFFRAELIGDEKVRACWDWTDLQKSDPLLDKIVIKHSQGNYPDSRLGGEVFEIGDWDPADKPMWAKVFTDLTWDREHYFALYMHEKDSSWVDPLYASTHVEDWNKHDVIFNADGVKMAFQVTNIAQAISISTTDTTLYTLTNSQNDMIYFQNDFVDQPVIKAILNIEINTGSGGTLLIMPMRSELMDGETYDLSIDGIDRMLVDRTIRKEYQISSADEGTIVSIDISDVFAKAAKHHTAGIAIIGNDPTVITLYYDTLYLYTEVVEKW